MLHDVARKLCSNVSVIMSNPRNVTVSVKTMQESVLMTLTGDLKKHAISAARDSVTKYTRSESHNNGQEISIVKRSGLIIDPLQVKHILITYIPSVNRYADTLFIYTASVLEYLLSEILELSGNEAKDLNKKTIDSDHIFKAIQNDEELKIVFD